MPNWYKRKYDVDIDYNEEVVVTMGAKEGIGHLVLATISQGEIVFVPTPAYPDTSLFGGDSRRRFKDRAASAEGGIF